MRKALGWLWARKWRRVCTVVFLVGVAGLLLPHRGVLPVKGATRANWHPETFWYYPWGPSVTHKGLDIFAKEDTPVLAMSSGLVVYKGTLSRGGNVVVILGAKWRLQYYAHLQEFDTHLFAWASRGEQIGRVGTTGNAKGKPAHLHYSYMTLLPYPWEWRSDLPQGWQRMFYLNPEKYF